MTKYFAKVEVVEDETSAVGAVRDLYTRIRSMRRPALGTRGTGVDMETVTLAEGKPR